jgi:FtsP/CotA-like multicopper oxidase with cupredoxin domain
MKIAGKVTWIVLGLVFLLAIGLITAGFLVKAGETQKAVTAANPTTAPTQTQTQTPTQTTVVATGQVRNFTLYVRDATLTMPDGQQIYVFGFTDDPNGHAKVPGPTIMVDEGDTVNLTLVNDKDPTKTEVNPDGDGHTIHLHGLDLPSQFDGDPMTAPDGHAVMEGQTYTYKFVASQPGTFYYHCHESAAEHIQMGMYGALVVRPKGLLNAAYAGTPTFDKQYTFVLSEFDSKQHDVDYAALHAGGDEANWSQYQPNYFLINGKAWPDTLMDLADNINATVGQKVLVRLINAGGTTHSMHTHGYHFQVIGSDGRKLAQPYDKDTITLGPGERYDILITLNQAGRFMFHDHIEQNTTNDGSYPGGMMTMINTNLPDGSNPIPALKMEPDPATLQDLKTKLDKILDDTNEALTKGNFDDAHKGYGLFSSAWDKSETIVQQASKDTYRAIEDGLSNWKVALSQQGDKPDAAKLKQAVDNLKAIVDKIAK